MKPEALGFGMMRLPVSDGEPTNIDYKTLNSMVDTFLDAGILTPAICITTERVRMR